MDGWGFAIGTIICFIVGGISYAKGIEDGFEKKNQDIEKMLDRAIKRAKENNNELR